MPERHSPGLGGGGELKYISDWGGVKAFLHLKLAIWVSLG